MPRVNANWFLTGFTWLLAIGLTFWNLATIEAVSKARDQSERLRNELLFHRQYAGKLESIRQTAVTYTLPVESAKLGFLGAQNRLETLGAIFGLAPFMVARQAGAAMPEQWPLTVSCEGSLENTVRFLNALEDYPYLPVRRIQLKINEEHFRTAAEIQLVLQFRLEDAEDPPPAPLRTTRYVATGEDHPS